MLWDDWQGWREPVTRLHGWFQVGMAFRTLVKLAVRSEAMNSARKPKMQAVERSASSCKWRWKEKSYDNANVFTIAISVFQSKVEVFCRGINFVLEKGWGRNRCFTCSILSCVRVFLCDSVTSFQHFLKFLEGSFICMKCTWWIFECSDGVLLLFSRLSYWE